MHRARQPQAVAKRRAFVFGSKQATTLKFGHQQVDNALEPARQIRRDDIETIARLVAIPFLHHVRDLRGIALDENVATRGQDVLIQRSEEHTSELQSLMRNSYAVF